MLKARIILFIIFLLLNLSTGVSQQKSESKNILILFGLSPTQPAYRPILDGIRQKLNEEFGDSYNLHTEYLEIESYPKDNYPGNRFDIYNNKYREIKLDLLIVVGRNAVNVIKNNAEDFLLNLPAISIDFDFSNYGYNKDLRLNEKTVVVGLKFEVTKMISTALSVFPASSSIYFIGGTAPFDRFMMSLVNQVAGKVEKNKRIEIMTDLSMDQILKQVRRLPVRSIIFIPSFNTDSKLVTYYNNESMRLISATANSPVFSYSDVGFGDGAIGGYLISFRKVSLLTGETAVKILNGADPNLFKVTEQDYYEYLFDWRELKRFNLINSELIPKESTILFEQITFFGKYKWILGVTLLFLILQSAFIANLIRLNRKQKSMTKQVKETENMYRDLLHEDRSLRLGQLTASLSHELNQPLTAIQYSAQAGMRFLKSGDLDSKQTEEILGNIIEDNKRAAGIISSIRSMMKIETREMENVNLNSLIEETINIFHAEALYQHIQIKRGLQDDPVYVLGDKIQLQQIILNFMSNAAAAMEKNDSENKILGISQLVENGLVKVSVRDSGPGIDDAIKDKLFQPFVTSRKSGLGIGLAISKSIIEKHKGEIWADNNTKDGGAEFSFKLKVIKDE
jgi:signal transduction histidine kinase